MTPAPTVKGAATPYRSPLSEAPALLPCPNGHAAAHFVSMDANGDWEPVTYGVHCGEDACAWCVTDLPSEREAIAAWNRRASAQPEVGKEQTQFANDTPPPCAPDDNVAKPSFRQWLVGLDMTDNEKYWAGMAWQSAERYWSSRQPCAPVERDWWLLTLTNGCQFRIARDGEHFKIDPTWIEVHGTPSTAGHAVEAGETWFCPSEHPDGKHGPKCRIVSDTTTPERTAERLGREDVSHPSAAPPASQVESVAPNADNSLVRHEWLEKMRTLRAQLANDAPCIPDLARHIRAGLDAYCDSRDGKSPPPASVKPEWRPVTMDDARKVWKYTNPRCDVIDVFGALNAINARVPAAGQEKAG